MFCVCVCVSLSPCLVLPYCKQKKHLCLSVCLSVFIHQHPSSYIKSPQPNLLQMPKHKMFLLQHQEFSPGVLKSPCRHWDGYVFLFQRPSPDIKSSLYELLHTLVVNNWRYFFPGNVLEAMQKQGDTVEHVSDLTAIFQVTLYKLCHSKRHAFNSLLTFLTLS